MARLKEGSKLESFIHCKYELGNKYRRMMSNVVKKCLDNIATNRYS
ncbi:hypothetical protein ACFSCX_13400 [Bacillus salitolerans]|uniref:Uncharacterized protein n=1 Tax=Bacillus salitolerans TaxID=1437434 RepID=A0ABW4LQY0_9BACI